MNTRSKSKNTLFHEYTNSLKLVSPSKLYNHCHQDDYTDILNLTYEKEFSAFQREMFKQGCKFEHLVLKSIIEYFPDMNVYSLLPNTCVFEAMDEVYSLMVNGTQVIHNIPFIDTINNTRGVYDFIVRSDILSTIFPTIVGTPYERELSRGCSISDTYHYIPIDTKFKTLDLKSDGITLSSSFFETYVSSQLDMYSESLHFFQGFKPTIGIVCGRKSTYTRKGIKTKNNSFFNSIAVIPLTDKVNKNTEERCHWFRSLSVNTTHPLPNMKHVSEQQRRKQEVAVSNKHLSLLWNTSFTVIQELEKEGIVSYDDERCCSEKLRMKGKRGYTVDRILETQRQSSYLYKFDNIPVLPPEDELVCFVDFETIPSPLLDTLDTVECTSKTHLFLIGVLFRNPTTDDIEYKSFKVDEYHTETDIVNEFVEFIRPFQRIIHWSPAEPSIWNSVSDIRLPFFDLCSVFINTPITVKGVLNFKLKSVAGKLYEYGIIKTPYNTNIINGLDCSVEAYKWYLNERPQSVWDDIIRYNEIDCKVLQELYEFVRTHTKL